MKGQEEFMVTIGGVLFGALVIAVIIMTYITMFVQFRIDTVTAEQQVYAMDAAYRIAYCLSPDYVISVRVLNEYGGKKLAATPYCNNVLAFDDFYAKVTDPGTLRSWELGTASAAWRAVKGQAKQYKIHIGIENAGSTGIGELYVEIPAKISFESKG